MGEEKLDNGLNRTRKKINDKVPIDKVGQVSDFS